MKKFKVDKSQVLSKNAQQQVLGGRSLTLCPRGCYDNYLDAIGHPVCAVVLPNGNVCRGTVQNNQCCL